MCIGGTDNDPRRYRVTVLDEPAQACSLAAVCRLRFGQRDVAGRHVSSEDGQVDASRMYSAQSATLTI